MGLMMVAPLFSVVSSSLSYAADKETAHDPYQAVEDLASRTNKQIENIIGDVNKKNQALADCINAVEVRLEALIKKGVKEAKDFTKEKMRQIIQSETKDITIAWTVQKETLWDHIRILAQMSETHRIMPVLEDVMQSPSCSVKISAYAKDLKMSKWDVEKNEIYKAQAYAHFDQISLSPDVLNLCYSVALSGYSLFDRIGQKKTRELGHVKTILYRARLMLDNWMEYFKELFNVMFKMSGCPGQPSNAKGLLWQMQNPECHKVLSIVKHEQMLAKDKLNTIKYLDMFARAPGDEWYPDRGNSRGGSCTASTQGLCRKCSKNHQNKVSCGEFKTSPDKCAEGGFVYLPRGDSMNCNWQVVDQIHHNPWQSFRHYMRPYR